MRYNYTHNGLSERVFDLLESVICTKKATGRLGMDLWTIFVLGAPAYV